MIAGLDSSFDRPSPATAAAARAAGVRVWGGYIGTRGGLGLATLWSQADFDVVRNAGMTAIGFCSGWDDPGALRAMAADWGVRLCVDVEHGIRDDGDWVQGWLDASGAGLYGNSSVHYNTGGRGAAFHVVSYYFRQPPVCYDPQMTWPWWLPALAAPTGWQCCGTHSMFGLSVDFGNYDDWFAGAFTGGELFEMTKEEHDWLHDIKAYVDNTLQPFLSGYVVGQLNSIEAKLGALSVVSPDAAAIRADIEALKADLDGLTLKKA